MRHRRGAVGSGRGSAGFSLIETLVAVAILSLVFSAIALGIVTSIKASASVNERQRAETLLTGYAEAMKHLDYTVCASPNTYMNAFDAYELLQPEPLLPSGASASVEVTAVDNGCGANASDAGRQILDLAVTVGDNQVFGQAVKRDPNAIPVQLTADFSWSILNGGRSSVGLVLDDTTVPVAGSSIMDYQWTFPTAPTTVTGPDESEIVRIVPAVLGSETSIVVTMTVTDSAGRSDSETKTIPIPAASPSPTTSSTTSSTTTTTSTTIPTPPPGPAPAPVGFTKIGHGCCETYGDFQWEKVPFATEYLIRADGYFLGGCVTDHSDVILDPHWSPTPNGSTMTGRLDATGLCLGSNYNVSIQAKVNGVWGQPATMNVTL